MGSPVYPGHGGRLVRTPRYTGQALINQKLEELLNKFEYPDELGGGGGLVSPGGGGMVHVLIVADSEPDNIQAKADFIVSSDNSATQLQTIFDSIDSQSNTAGAWSVWMAGIFELDDDVTAPARCWIRGLGYTLAGGSF